MTEVNKKIFTTDDFAVLEGLGPNTKLYYNKINGSFEIGNQRNAFVELLKAIFLVNVFKYTFRGFSNDKNTVFTGFASKVKTLNSMANPSKDFVIGLRKVHTEVLPRLITASSSQEIIKTAIEHLQSEIATFLEKYTKSNTKPKPAEPQPAATAQLKEAPAQHSIASSSYTPSESEESVEAEEPAKKEISLPTPSEYKRPKFDIKVPPHLDTPEMRNKQLLEKTSQAYDQIKEAYEEYVRSSAIVSHLTKEMEAMKPAAPQPTVQSSNGMPPPPPPPPSAGTPPPPPPSAGAPPPPPPPGAGKAKSGKTWAEKQKEQYLNKDVKPSAQSLLIGELIPAQKKVLESRSLIMEALFPQYSNIEISDTLLKEYVANFKGQAEETIAEATKLNAEYEKQKKAKAAQRDAHAASSSSQEDTLAPEVKRAVASLEKAVKAVDTHKKQLKRLNAEIENKTVEIKQKTDEQNKIAKKLISSGLDTSAKQVKEFENLGNQIEALKLEVERKQQDVAEREKKLDTAVTRLASLAKQPENRDVESIKRATTERIEGLKEGRIKLKKRNTAKSPEDSAKELFDSKRPPYARLGRVRRWKTAPLLSNQ